MIKNSLNKLCLITQKYILMKLNLLNTAVHEDEISVEHLYENSFPIKRIFFIQNMDSHFYLAIFSLVYL